MTSNNFASIDMFCALDVGKSTPTALLADGRTTFDKPLSIAPGALYSAPAVGAGQESRTGSGSTGARPA